jgi:hypothetical protein
LIEREVRLVFFNSAQSSAASLRKKVLMLTLEARQPIIFSSDDLLRLFADEAAPVDLVCLVALLMAQRGAMHPDAPATVSFHAALAATLDKREACWQVCACACMCARACARLSFFV